MNRQGNVAALLGAFFLNVAASPSAPETLELGRFGKVGQKLKFGDRLFAGMREGISCLSPLHLSLDALTARLIPAQEAEAGRTKQHDADRARYGARRDGCA